MTAPSESGGRTGTLYLVPVPLGDVDPTEVLPTTTLKTAAALVDFIAENPRTARRFLTRFPLAAPIQSIRFEELNEHTAAAALRGLLTPLLQGRDVGLVSEAGCPAVADPGSALVALAHRHGIRVVPLVGPNAPLLALMASGMNGNAFRFHGYLPAESQARSRRIREIEADSARDGAAQAFIETPYRGDALLDALLANSRPDTAIGVAIDLTLPTEEVVVRPAADWKDARRPALAKRPAVFLLQAGSMPATAASRTKRPRS
ncbi:MAG: SAM-dependent methyltransferase [Burkholderiales bacterium]|nr:SAM-dependent methyltransferase [Burkholderiales bacterium]